MWVGFIQPVREGVYAHLDGRANGVAVADDPVETADDGSPASAAIVSQNLQWSPTELQSVNSFCWFDPAYSIILQVPGDDTCQQSDGMNG